MCQKRRLKKRMFFSYIDVELAEDYENRANIAESRGYSRYADILRVIADEFKREAKRNILEARNGDDE